MFIYLLLAIFSAVVVINYYMKNRAHSKLPPGPQGIPLLGNLLSIAGKMPYLQFREWSKKYGSIMMIKIFNTRLVIISDLKLAREAFNKPAVSGKADVQVFSLYLNGPENYQKNCGIMGSDFQTWQDQRQFTVRHLREFGFQKRNIMEGNIIDELSYLIWSFESANGQPFSPTMIIAQTAANVVWRMVAGERFAPSEEQLQLIQRAMHKHRDLLESPIATFLPRVTKFFGKISGWDELTELSGEIQKIFIDQIEKHEKSFVASDHPRDFIDAYLQTIHNDKERDGKVGFDLQNLQAVVAELYISAMEPLSISIAWIILYLSSFPEIKKKFQEEIDQVVGKERLPSLEDKINMPYTEALINESFRKASLTPLGLFHITLEDVEIGGFKIPKNAWICNNIYKIHHDPEIWGDPENFRPERFLTVNETDGSISFQKYDELLAFSFGRRACFGELISRNTIFMILVRIYQIFDVSFDPNAEKPSLESITTVLRFPNPYNIVVKHRNC